MYWIISVAGTVPRIEKGSMDGSNRLIFYASSSVQPKAIFVDFLTETLYWADNTHSNALMASNLDGTLRRTVIDFVPLRISFYSILSMVVHNNTLYYVGYFPGIVAVSFLSTASDPLRFLYSSSCTNGDGIQIIHEDRQQQGI